MQKMAENYTRSYKLYKLIFAAFVLTSTISPSFAFVLKTYNKADLKRKMTDADQNALVNGNESDSARLYSKYWGCPEWAIAEVANKADSIKCDLCQLANKQQKNYCIKDDDEQATVCCLTEKDKAFVTNTDGKWMDCDNGLYIAPKNGKAIQGGKNKICKDGQWKDDTLTNVNDGIKRTTLKVVDKAKSLFDKKDEQPAAPVKQPAEPAKQPAAPVKQPAEPAKQPVADVEPAQPATQKIEDKPAKSEKMSCEDAYEKYKREEKCFSGLGETPTEQNIRRCCMTQNEIDNIESRRVCYAKSGDGVVFYYNEKTENHNTETRTCKNGKWLEKSDVKPAIKPKVEKPAPKAANDKVSSCREQLKLTQSDLKSFCKGKKCCVPVSKWNIKDVESCPDSDGYVYYKGLTPIDGITKFECDEEGWVEKIEYEL